MSDHPATLPAAEIIAAIPWGSLYGVWVQYHGDGTTRCREGEVIVSVQYGTPGNRAAHEGRGANVRDASAALLATLRGGVWPVVEGGT